MEPQIAVLKFSGLADTERIAEGKRPPLLVRAAAKLPFSRRKK
jgi:hypothetical protein